MPFHDGEYGIALSNSVIQHFSTLENQQRFTEEIRRVGRCVWVQTPAYEFFIEPHFIAPFVHYLPARIAQKLLRVFSVRAWLRRGDNVELDQLDRELRLLTASEMRTLFPDCILHRERWCGLTKSFVMVRR
jgi:hypothetical protein